MSPVMVLANEPEWPPTWLENSGASPEPVRLGGAVESVVDAVATEVEGSAADMELGAWSQGGGEQDAAGRAADGAARNALSIISNLSADFAVNYFSRGAALALPREFHLR